MIKKILFAAAAFLFLIPASLQAKEVVRLTRYMGQPISGVTASDSFKVELVKSTETRAVVEIDAELEPYLRFELRPDGVVSVKLSIPNSEHRRLERSQGWNNKIIKLTLYLPECRTVRLSDMSRMTTDDIFHSGLTEIHTEDMARIDRMGIDGDIIRIKTEDLSSVNLNLTGGAVTLRSDDMSKANLRGEIRELNADAHDMARIDGNELHARRVTLKTTDMARASVHAVDYLFARASDLSSVSYEGNPRNIDLKTPTRTIHRLN